MPDTASQLLLDGAHAHPDRLLLVNEDEQHTYAGAAALAHARASGLAELGVGWQVPVLMMLDNHPDCCLTFLGMHLLGQIEVPVNTAYKGTLLAHVINDCQARVMVIEHHYLPRVVDILDELRTLETVIVRGAPGAVSAGRLTVVAFEDLEQAEQAALPTIAPWDLLGILYTSGTTGPSKGVLVPHAHATGCYRPSHWTADEHRETVLITLPLFHLGGQWGGLLYAMHGGGTAVVQAGFSATRFWDQVRDFGCTQTLMVGAVANFLYRQPATDRDRDHPLRRVIMVPTMPELREFEARFGVEVGSAYGLTEGSTPIVAPYGTGTPGGCGVVRSGFEVRLVDEHDREVPVGVPGEALVRSDEPWHTMAGYHARPEATVEAWRNHWLHTGDMLVRTAAGGFSFLDRGKDAIRRRGENVSSYEVEAEINRHPAVLESAVIAVPSSHTEDDIKAVVVPRPGADVACEELIRHLVERLPYFMVPRYYEFLAELPKTPTEKILKSALREAGLTAGTLDREAMGIEVRRDG
jgi:crotonobetaine/carnitine-CoA ligase